MKTKKILLCGCTFTSNFGDYLFAKIFFDAVKNKGFEGNYILLSDFFKLNLGLPKITIKDFIKADALVYISGGYFGPRSLMGVKNLIMLFLRYYAVGIYMLIRKKPIAVIGLEAGPLKNRLLTKVCVTICNKAKVLSVRNQNSKDYLTSIGVKREIISSSDTAHLVCRNSYLLPKKLVQDFQSVLKGKHKVFIHCTGTNRHTFINIVMKAIIDVFGNNPDVGFVVGGDMLAHIDIENEVYSMLPPDRTFRYRYENPLDLLGILSNIDTVITAKLHVGIVASSLNKSVICFARHKDKIERYYKQIGYPERCTSLDTLTYEKAVEMLERFSYEKIVVPQKCFDNATLNMQLLDEFLEKEV